MKEIRYVIVCKVSKLKEKIEEKENLYTRPTTDNV